MNNKSKAVLTAIAEEQERKKNMHPDHANLICVAKILSMSADEVHKLAIALEKDGEIGIRPTINSWGYSIKIID